MKVHRIIGTTALVFLFAAAVPAFAQNEHQNEDKAPKQEQQAKPQKQQQQPQQRAQQQNQNKQQQQQAKQEQNQNKQQQRAQQQNQNDRQQQRNTNQEQNGRQEHQRSVAEQQRQRSEPELRLSQRGDSRIPDDRFRSNFGRGHEFRIGSPRMVDGYSRFQYGGYWFGFVQPWPVGWYYTDDVYVEYIDGGYFLIDPYYPGTRLSISVVM
ncbi:MAG: hypothetical protein RB191_15520 [Terriglobia bacterium]|nr:hypothetical protein [Terriglobia bacterium]